MAWSLLEKSNTSGGGNSLTREYGFDYNADNQYTDQNRRSQGQGVFPVTINGLADSVEEYLPTGVPPYWNKTTNLIEVTQEGFDYLARLRFNQFTSSTAKLEIRFLSSTTNFVVSSDTLTIDSNDGNRKKTIIGSFYSGQVPINEDIKVEIEVITGTTVQFWDFDIKISKVA